MDKIRGIIKKCIKITYIIPDKMYLTLMFYIKMHRKINWNNPKTFNEKLQWLKLYDRNPEYTTLVDKYKVKEFVVKTIGEEHIISTLGVWEKFEDINFDALPNQFVLKCTHDSGGVVIVKDKEKIDIPLIREKIEKAMKVNYYYLGREWVYKHVEPRIICEEYIGSDENELIDYKLMCFNGKVKCTFICSNRERGKLFVNFYDRKWNPMPFIRHYPKNEKEFSKPILYENMVSLAEKLAQNIKFVRVDFYIRGEKILFGEMTFYPGNGMEKFEPEEWDRKLGDWLEL